MATTQLRVFSAGRASEVFDHAKPAGVREKSALMHDAQESNSAPPARAPRPLLGLQQDRRAAAMQ